MNTSTLGDGSADTSATPSRAERAAQDFGSPGRTCNAQVKRFLGRQGSLIELKELVTARVHELVVDMDKVTRECVLSHYLPAFVEAQVPDLVAKLDLITECTDKLQVESRVREATQGWVDALWTLLLHRCKCDQALGSMPGGVMAYPLNDGLDASRGMQLAEYMLQVPRALDCAQADYLAEVYGLAKVGHA